MTITLKGSRIVLAAVWGVGFVVPLAILAAQTFLGTVYHGKESEAWNWFTPNIVPTIGLIVATYASTSSSAKSEKKSVSMPLFVIALVLSVLYVSALILIFAMTPLTNSPPLETYKRSSLFLGVIQGVVTGALGAFFIKNTKR